MEQPIQEYDANGKLIHCKDTDGFEEWSDYDDNGNMIHYKNSDGYEYWREYDSNGNFIHDKNSEGQESWREYDSNGNCIHFKDSDDFESWYDSNGKSITKPILETIECAAILDVNGKAHYISKPARHHHILWWMKGRLHEVAGLTSNDMQYEEHSQGFMTNTGRYVDRVEAAQIALKAGQYTNLNGSDLLFSEDLW